MSRSIVRYTAYLQIVLVLATGCAPTQPFFIAKDNSMAHYLDQALAIEYADVQVESLPEASQAHQPLGPANAEREFVDLSLEDCISFALQNAKILPVSTGANAQTGPISNLLLSAQPGQLPSVYDSALISSIASTQPLQVDNQGNRIPFRGAIRSNQVGGVEDALSEFDAQYSSLLGYNTTDRPRNVGPNNIFNPQLFQGVDANYQSALSKKTATGGVVTARLTTVYSNNNVGLGVGRGVPSDYTQALEMQITHPLLRGRGTMVNRIPVVLARINEDIALHDFEGNVRNLVKATEDAYWDLYCGYRIVESSQQSLDTAAYLWRVAADRARAGGPPEAEAQARGLLGTFQNQMLAAKHGSSVPGNDPRGLYGREQVLREKIGWAPTDSRLIRPSDVPSEARVNFDWCEVLGEALVRNVELRKQKWFIKSVELEIASAKNQLLPELNVTGIHRWVGVGDVLAKTERTGLEFPDAGSSALESLTDGQFQELGARLEFTPPAIGSRRPKAGVQNRKLALAKAQAELQEKEILLAHELSNWWRNMDATYEQMRVLRDQWAALTEEIKVYRDKIENNTGELPQLLDSLLRSEERRGTAQRSYYQAVCEYNKSIISIHYWKGSLLDLDSIALEEGPWPAKAYWDADELAKQRAAGHYFDYGYTRPAVVSRGPVERGLPTEGQQPMGDDGMNAKVQGTPTPADPTQGEKTPPASGSEFPELKDMENRRAPESVPPQQQNESDNRRTNAPRRSQGAPKVTSGKATGNSASISASQANEWGELESQAAPVVTASSTRNIQSTTQANRHPTNQMRSSAGSSAQPNANEAGKSQWRAKAGTR